MVSAEPAAFADPWTILSLRDDPNRLEGNHDTLRQVHCSGATILWDVYEAGVATVTERSSARSGGEYGYGLLPYWTALVDRSTTPDQEGTVW